MTRKWGQAARLLVLVALTGCGREEAETPEAGDFLKQTVVAEVGDYVVTAADLDARLRNQYDVAADLFDPTTERSIRELLRSDVDRFAMVSEAERLGIDEADPKFRQAMEVARRKILADIYTEDVLYKQIEPTERELRQYYEENLGSYSVPVRRDTRHILVKTRADAERAMARLAAGEAFADLAREMSLDDGTKRSGGSLGLLRHGQSLRGLGEAPEFIEAVFAMPLGETQIIESPLGFHVTHVEKELDAATRSFESVRDQIESRLMRIRSSVAVDSTLRALRVKYNARIYDENLAAYLSWRRAKPEEESFTRAQNEADPHKKIAIYEDYLRRFAHSEHAAKAKFMIAFTYAEELKNRQKARMVLNEFLKEYPESDLAESARYMMEELSAVKGTN